MKQDAKSQSGANTGKTNGQTTSPQKLRKNSEYELGKRFQRAVDAGRIFSWEMNPATRKLEWSNNMEAVIGFPMFDDIDKTFELFHLDDYQSVVDQINEAIETGSDFETEYRLVNPANGEVCWFHSQGAVTTDTVDGSPCFSGITQNITERKQNEEALRESEEQIAADLAGMRRLYALQSKLANQTDVKAALADVLALACEFTGTDRGCVQLLSDDRERLEMAVWQGYADDSHFIDFFRYEGFEKGCEVTRVHRQRLIIEETIGFPGLDGTEAGAATYADGIRAAQSTPMTNRSGDTIGVISTQFREPHRPSDHELRLIDMLAWTAAEFLERHRAEEVLRESEARLRIAVEAAELGTWEWNLETDEVKCNERHLELFGIKPQENPIKLETLIKNVHEEDRAWMEKSFAESAESAKSQMLFESEFRVRLETGEIRWMDGYGQAVEVSGEKTIRMSGVTSDITARKRAEEALRLSEEQSRLLIEGATDTAIIKITTDGLIASWNSGAQKVFGYTESEIVNQPFDILFTAEDRKNKVPQKELETALENGCAEDERWHQRKDGTRICISGIVTPLKEGNEGFVKIARDQTFRLEVEKAQRDKEIMQRLAQAQEDERKRFSRDLHDELGQQLTALRMKLDHFKILCRDSQNLCAQIDEIQSIARSIDDGVDFLAWELRPSLLDDLGLSAAMEKYVKEWSQHSGAAAEFIGSKINGIRLAPEIEINFYRILQESLNNIHKHAKAETVSVILDKRGDSIILIVEDDGIGFDSENDKTRSKGLGLTGIQERAALMGGNVEIESASKQGTSVYVRVPIAINKKVRK